MNKTFTNRDIVGIVNYINTIDAEKMKCLPTKMRWNIKKNMDKLIPIAQRFEKFKDEIIADMRAEWFNEEKSEEFSKPITDNQGNPILDEDGNEQTEPGRRVKEEFMEEFNKAIKDINIKLDEILSENIEVDLSSVDVDSFVDNMDDDCPLSFEDLNVIAAFQEE